MSFRWLDLICPELCLQCGDILQTYGICNKCWDKLTFLNANACTRCYKQFSLDIDDMMCGNCEGKQFAISKMRAPLQYDSHSSHMIMQFKNHANMSMLQLLIDMMCVALVGIDFDLIVPVPIHITRLVWRGYNQSSILAKHLSASCNKPWAEGLNRVRMTKSQGGLQQKDRRSNLKNAFKATGSFFGKKILLVDDVITTSSTIEECGRALRAAGAIEVFGLAIAKT